MSYLLDTGVLGESRRSVPDPHVTAWLSSVEGAQLFTSVMVLGEIRRGCEIIRPRDAARATALDRWITLLTRRFDRRALPITLEIAEAWARMSAPDRLPEIDGLIAATAHVHGLTVVTRNIKDFERTGVPCLNPFEPA
ncbi:type II toxin-antitoxin system VapC family toxin [Nocardiopsis halophila]|uniref:type II toxin-antitoxin system VapC family toxin n=1 Tax=Nocardiopsis halophila TaxID=141692 RepID=UPI0003464427|nr:type II toxin-antitoxin system VapC family toxin [Nocardiopsis halophila]